MLGQKDVARRLEACYPDPIAIEECLSGYIFWKVEPLIDSLDEASVYPYGLRLLRLTTSIHTCSVLSSLFSSSTSEEETPTESSTRYAYSYASLE
jgi:hypothetical protein